MKQPRCVEVAAAAEVVAFTDVAGHPHSLHTLAADTARCACRGPSPAGRTVLPWPVPKPRLRRSLTTQLLHTQKITHRDIKPDSGLQDRATGHLKFGARWYDPATGT